MMTTIELSHENIVRALNIWSTLSSNISARERMQTAIMAAVAREGIAVIGPVSLPDSLMVALTAK